MTAISIAATIIMRTSHGLVTGFSSCVDGLSLNHCLTSSNFRSSYVVPLQVQGLWMRAWYGADTGIQFRMVSARLFWNESLSLIWFQPKPVGRKRWPAANTAMSLVQLMKLMVYHFLIW